MSFHRFSRLALVTAMVFTSFGCAAAQRAASKDPMRCERDPKCSKKNSDAFDCSRQCNDDPACMDRCEQVQQPNGGLGH